MWKFETLKRSGVNTVIGRLVKIDYQLHRKIIFIRGQVLKHETFNNTVRNTN